MLVFAAFTLLSLALGALAQVTVNTPVGVVQCQPTQFTWSGGVAPYFLTFVVAGNPGDVVETIAQPQTTTTYMWIADLPVGSYSLAVKDSTGAQGFSGAINVAAGTVTTCLGTNPNGGTGASSSSSISPGVVPTTSASTSTSVGTTAATTSPRTTSTPASTTATSSRASSTSSPNSSYQISPPFTTLVGLLALVFFTA